MCFNYKVSLFTFIIGTLFSVILIKYGNPKYVIENKASGIFFIFISLIQFMDFLFWIDINNKFGINNVMSILGPILNVGQPTILYLIKYLIYKPNITTFANFNLPVAILNVIYFINFVSMYITYLLKDKHITKVHDGHLTWPWIKYSNLYFYLLMLAVNIFYLFNFKYALSLFIITYFFLFISYKYFYYNAGELWCFFGSFIPLIMYFISFYVDKLL